MFYIITPLKKIINNSIMSNNLFKPSVNGGASFDLSNLVISNPSVGVLHCSSTGAISSSQVVNADVSNTAAIAYSKLNLGTSITNSDISGTAAIAYSKLNLGTSIVNGDLANTTIQIGKLNTNVYSQNGTASTLAQYDANGDLTSRKFYTNFANNTAGTQFNLGGFYNTTMVATSECFIDVGISSTNSNSAYILFHKGAAAASTWLEFGVRGISPTIRCYESGALQYPTLTSNGVVTTSGGDGTCSITSVTQTGEAAKIAQMDANGGLVLGATTSTVDGCVSYANGNIQIYQNGSGTDGKFPYQPIRRAVCSSAGVLSNDNPQLTVNKSGTGIYDYTLSVYYGTSLNIQVCLAGTAAYNVFLTVSAQTTSTFTIESLDSAGVHVDQAHSVCVIG